MSARCGPGRAVLVLALTGSLIACGDAPTSRADWTVALLEPRGAYAPERLWSFARSSCVFDPECGLLLPPDRVENWTWPEHAGGEFTLRSNNLGLLESAPTLPEKHGLRILVVGDSHLVVVDTDESFPNLLEAALRSSGYHGCEVLASGVGYTGPSLYLRRVQRFLDLEPDAVIVSFFTGNDLWDDLLLAYDVPKSPRPLLDADYERRLDRCRELHGGALFQGLNQAHFFKHWPGTGELGLELALRSLAKIQALCASKGILLAVLLLPTKVAVDVEDEPEVRADALATLELSEDEAAVNERLGARAVATLRERGSPCLDPTQAMLADPRPFYWRKDHHLSTAGHAYGTRALFEAFEPLLAARGRRKER